MPTPDDIETPAVLIDLEKVSRNLSRAQQAADRAGVALRPHIKTHKLPRFARAQVDLGAVGITCQKLGEAEVMAEAGVGDILITYNILGAAKLARLRRLAESCTLAVTADHPDVVDGYSAAMDGAAAPLRVLVECDTGMGRCGVQSPAEAVSLAQRIAAAGTLRFGGLMTYPAAGSFSAAAQWLADAAAQLEAAGLPAKTITSGGTPDMWNAIGSGPATEYRPGTYIYMDRSQVAAGACTFEECALRVVATVASAPAEGRVVIDAGSKALSSDTLGLDGFGHLPDYPNARIVKLSEEHGVIDVSACPTPPQLGERVTVIPNHACVVTNLFDEVWLVDTEGQADAVPVVARGKVA